MKRCAWTVPAAWLFGVFVVRGGGTETENQVKLYFAVGCFWHVQHSFIKAEETILQRSGVNLTSLAGYAGAKIPGTACYYDEKVTAEVVGLEIPSESISKFAEIYFKHFVGHDRSHANDIGPHYRAAIGLPGGIGSSLLGEITKSQMQGQNFELREGQGDDADTLHSSIIWVYDSDRFPFYQAELYHQFHDDYCCNGDYPASYESLRTVLTCAGKLKPTGCRRDDMSVVSQLECKKPSDKPSELDKPNQLDSLSEVVPSGGSGDLADTNTNTKMNPVGNTPSDDSSSPKVSPTQMPASSADARSANSAVVLRSAALLISVLAGSILL